jgi:hypothetical protein
MVSKPSARCADPLPSFFMTRRSVMSSETEARVVDASEAERVGLAEILLRFQARPTRR